MRRAWLLVLALAGCSRGPTHVATSRSCIELPAQSESRSTDIALALVSSARACGAVDFAVAAPAARDGIALLGATSAALGRETQIDDDVRLRRGQQLFVQENVGALRDSAGAFLGLGKLSAREIPTGTTAAAVSTFDLSARFVEPMKDYGRFRFQSADGHWSQVEMASAHLTKALVGEIDGDRLVDLSFESPGLAILFVVPNRTRSVDDDLYQRWLAALHPAEVEVHLPLFQLATTFDAMPLAAALKLSTRFGSHAVALQYVKVGFDGHGINSRTFATAPLDHRDPRGENATFIADRPFFFFIHDTHQSSRFAILIAGDVEHPERP